MSNLLQEIEAQIAGVKTTTTKQNVGVVREISDGVAKIEGLTDAMLNEMLDFGNGVVGIALNLEETEVGAIILGDYTHVHEGSEVKTTGKLLSVPVGKGLLGRVVDSLGRPIDGKGPVKESAFYPLEKIAIFASDYQVSRGAEGRFAIRKDSGHLDARTLLRD